MKTLILLLNLLSFNVYANTVVVAVVDMGIASDLVYSLKPYMHEPLPYQFGWDFSINEKTAGIDYSYKYEQEFHGTFIAHLIARPDQVNTKRIKLLDVVYTDYHGNLFELNRHMFPDSLRAVYYKKKAYEKFSQHVAQTFGYAERAGAQVINFSSADRGFASIELKKYLEEAGTRNTIFVVSAGNDGYSLDESAQYPCSYDLANVICVGAVDSKNKKTEYSNYGKSIDFYSLGNFNNFEGTSFSAPLISRAVALILEKNPTWNARQIRKELTRFSFKKNKLLVFNHKAFHNFYH